MKGLQVKFKSIILILITVALTSFTIIQLQQKPVLYIVGDSTVQNNDGNGRNEYWGWGSLIYPYIDTNKISIRNHAKSGTSTRTFMSDGRWDKILETLKQGDFVLIQFGHNDNAEINDTARAKGTIKGLGEEVQEIMNLKTKKQETVHTYGWYLRKFVNEAKQKGAIPIICSLVPRDKWKDGKVVKEEQYPEWAEATAKTTGAYYINLNSIIAKRWEAMGAENIKAFFPGDHTHTNLKGAQLNAASVIEGVKQVKDCPLNNYLLQ